MNTNPINRLSNRLGPIPTDLDAAAADFLPDVEQVLSSNRIAYLEDINPAHISLQTDRIMIDPGFAADNKMLDVFIDEEHRILFIGLLRLPKEYRSRHLGRQIAKYITDWADANQFAVFLDSCGDSNEFWSKCGFRFLVKIDDFDIMGYAADMDSLRERWKYGKQIFLETH